MEQFERMKDEIVNILLNKDYNVCFIIGDNSCGKTDIAEMLKKKTSAIKIFDNFNQRYEDIPKDKKCVVITHSRFVLENANPLDMVVAIFSDLLYCVTNIEDRSVVRNLFNMISEKEISKTSILQRLLNNAVSGVWSNYNQEYLDSLKTETITKADKYILDTIDKFKKGM